MNEAEKLAQWASSVADEQELIHLISWVELRNGLRQSSALLRRQAEHIKVLRSALEEAASSLTYIANTACKRDEELMSDAINVRGYARSRASVAEATLAATKGAE